MIHLSSIHSPIDDSSSHLSCSPIILRCSGVISTLISWWVRPFVCHWSLNVHSQSNFQTHSFKMTTLGHVLFLSGSWSGGLGLSLDLDLGQPSGCWIRTELAIRGERSVLALKSCCSAICVGPVLVDLFTWDCHAGNIFCIIKDDRYWKALSTTFDILRLRSVLRLMLIFLECNFCEITSVWPSGLKINMHYPNDVQAFKPIRLTDRGQ